MRNCVSVSKHIYIYVYDFRKSFHKTFHNSFQTYFLITKIVSFIISHSLKWLGKLFIYPLWGHAVFLVIVIKFCRECYVLIPGLEKYEISPNAPPDAEWCQWDPIKFNEWRQIAKNISSNLQDIKAPKWEIKAV